MKIQTSKSLTLISDQTKPKTQKKEKKEKKSKRDLNTARQWNEEYCLQPCPSRHGRENGGEYLVVNHVHDYRSVPSRHDRGDLAVLGDDAHEVGGTG